MPNITSFLNINKFNVERQFDIARELKLKRIILTNSQNNIFDFAELIKNNIKRNERVYLINPNIKNHNIGNEIEHQERLNKYSELISNLKGVKYDYIALTLPKFKNLDEEKELLLSQIKDYEKLAIQAKVKFILLMQGANQPTAFGYLINQRIDKRRIFYSFNPKEIIAHNYPINTAYRLLRNDIELLIVSDLIDEYPTLVGKGRIGYFSLFKKFIRDNYVNTIAIDKEFTEFMYNYTPRKIKALFSKKQRAIKQIFDWSNLQINSSELTDIIKYQINLLEVIFKK